MAIQQTQLSAILESLHRDARPVAIDGYARERGFHIYGELRLTLKLTSADDVTDAQRYLDILQTYATVADSCARSFGASLLEVQGERIHLWSPSDMPSADAIQRVVAFSLALSATVYDKVAAIAGKEFKGFAMASDHGDTIFVRHGVGATASVISLSPAANAPAKRLGTGQDGSVKTPAQHLAFPTEKLRVAGLPAGKNDWELIPLTNVPQFLDKNAADRLTNAFKAAAGEQLLSESRRERPRVVLGDASYFQRDVTIRGPLKATAFYLRADLDGFTKEVAAAFSQGGNAVGNLIEKFTRILAYGDQFAARPDRKTILLPWAGDCANIVLFPKTGESFSAAKSYVPAMLPAEWHDQRATVNANRVAWSSIFGDARWAVGCAGGDVEDGIAPAMLIAPIQTSKRDFLIASGWAPGKSQDAIEAENVGADATVIPTEDYQTLDSQYQSVFKELDTRFWVAKSLTKSQLASLAIASSRQDKKQYIAAAGIHIPPAKHFWYEQSPEKHNRG